jgi:hypothetical protein
LKRLTHFFHCEKSFSKSTSNTIFQESKHI